jgi:NADH-quinone oxidoreductase subunit M
LRAVARVFFGEEKGVEEASDIGTAEKIPVFLLLLVLFLVGFWPRGLSDPVNSGSHLLHAPVERLVTE